MISLGTPGGVCLDEGNLASSVLGVVAMRVGRAVVPRWEALATVEMALIRAALIEQRLDEGGLGAAAQLRQGCLN